MSEITTVALDLAKNVSQLYGANASGRAVLRRNFEGVRSSKCWRGSRGARWRWKRAAGRTSGAGERKAGPRIAADPSDADMADIKKGHAIFRSSTLARPDPCRTSSQANIP